MQLGKVKHAPCEMATRDDVMDIVRSEILRAHNMTLEQYIAARKNNTLHRRSIDSAIEAMLGENARKPAQASSKRDGTKKQVFGSPAPGRSVRKLVRRASHWAGGIGRG